MNKPTVGRVVHYRENADAEPLAAVVAAVGEDGAVSLGVFTVNGTVQGVREVLHEDAAAPDACRWSWPPKA